MARYEKHEGEGTFWEITLKGSVISTRAGKLGAGASRDREGALYLYDRRGRTTNKELPDEATAKREYAKLVAKKQKEGFQLVGPAPITEVAPIEIAINPELETAILANPDDEATFLVYADWLIAQGDPRGELITTQHGMRGQSDPVKFMTFKKREEALRAAHLPSWLGETAAKALHRIKLDWQVGFIEAIRLDRPDNETEATLPELVTAVLACPLARFVRRLTLRGGVEHIVDAIPATPPPLLRRLDLLTERGRRGAPSGARTALATQVAVYRARGIEVEQGDYHEDDRYVAPRE